MPDDHPFSSIPTSILVPIDFSPSSQAALDAASDLAEHFQASLVMVNVVPCLSFLLLRMPFPTMLSGRRWGAR